MAQDKFDAFAVNELLYGVLASMFRVAGGSAAAVMRMAGTKMLEGLQEQGVTLVNGENHIENIGEKINKLFVEAGFCDSFKFVKTDDGVTCHVENCGFWPVTKQLKEHNVPPFACPFANLSMAVIQGALGQRSRVEKIEPGANEGDSDIHIHFI